MDEQTSKTKLFKYVLKKFLLTFLFIALLGISTWQLKDTFDDFADNPTNTLITLESKSQLQYPIVTICRDLAVTGIDYIKVQEDLNISETAVKLFVLGSGILFKSDCWFEFIDNLPNVNNWTVYQLEYERGLAKLNFTSDPKLLLAKIIDEYTLPFNFVSCEFNGYSHNKSICDQYFNKSLNLQKGLCMSLTDEGRQMIEPNQIFKFALEVDENLGSQLCGYTTEIYMSNTRDVLLPLFGAMVEKTRNTLTYIGLTTSTMLRIKNCNTETTRQYTYIPTSLTHNAYDYSIQNCVADLVVEDLFVKNQQCVPLLYENPNHLPWCDVFSISKLHKKWRRERGSMAVEPWYLPSIEEIERKCLPSCENTFYTHVERKSFEINTRGRSMVVFGIRFESEEVLRSTEQEKYTVAGWFSAIGGILGLWLGFSFFTLAKFANTVYRKYLEYRGDKVKMEEENFARQELFILLADWRKKVRLSVVQLTPAT